MMAASLAVSPSSRFCSPTRDCSGELINSRLEETGRLMTPTLVTSPLPTLFTLHDVPQTPADVSDQQAPQRGEEGQQGQEGI